jgi:hypothetical protein
MDLSSFIAQFDFPGSYVLLEGKRKVKSEDEKWLMELGSTLAINSQHMIFRSGNAPGSDELFARGVTRVDPNRLQLITPTSGHRKKYNSAGTTYSMDEINLATEPQVVHQTKYNAKAGRLVDRYASGIRDRNTIKVAYLIRDTVKVIGTSEIPPATFAIFYDDLDNPETGGTGHTIQICRINGVPCIDQREWMNWLINRSE